MTRVTGAEHGVSASPPAARLRIAWTYNIFPIELHACNSNSQVVARVETVICP